MKSVGRRQKDQRGRSRDDDVKGIWYLRWTYSVDYLLFFQVFCQLLFPPHKPGLVPIAKSVAIIDSCTYHNVVYTPLFAYTYVVYWKLTNGSHS